MTDSGWLFLNTPLPYLGAMYFLAYRHDLGRVIRPFRDLSNISEWHAVFKHLSTRSADPKPPKGPPLGSTRNLLLVIATLVIYAASAFASFFLAWYFLCAFQAAVAVPLFILLIMNRTGPFPFKPYRDVLPYPRLVSRVRHLHHARKGGEQTRTARDGTPTTAARMIKLGAAP